jgi:pimeloyl-ACP methyl ester carboxylesterase
MTGRGSGTPSGGDQGSGTTSFSERYAPPKPPRWRGLLSIETVQSVLTFLIAVGLIGLIGYLAWTSIERSGRLADPPARSASDVAVEPPGGSEVVELTSADGTVLSAWSTPAKAKKSKTAVILVHDAGGARTDLKRLAAALREEHDVMTLDLRGHGASADAATTLGPGEAEDVRAAIDAAVEQGNERIALVGVGLGASSVLAAAGGDSRVDGIVAVAPWPRVADAVSAQLRDDDVALAWPADWATLVAMLFRTGRDVTSADVMDTVTRTTAPILVVAGADDPLLPAATLRMLENLAPDLTTALVEGDRDAATAFVTKDDGIARIVDFIDASFKRDD